MSMKYFMSTTSITPSGEGTDKWDQEIDKDGEGTDEPARSSKQSLW